MGVKASFRQQREELGCNAASVLKLVAIVGTIIYIAIVFSNFADSIANPATESLSEDYDWDEETDTYSVEVPIFLFYFGGSKKAEFDQVEIDGVQEGYLYGVYSQTGVDDINDSSIEKKATTFKSLFDTFHLGPTSSDQTSFEAYAVDTLGVDATTAAAWVNTLFTDGVRSLIAIPKTKDINVLSADSVIGFRMSSNQGSNPSTIFTIPPTTVLRIIPFDKLAEYIAEDINPTAGPDITSFSLSGTYEVTIRETRYTEEENWGFSGNAETTDTEFAVQSTTFLSDEGAELTVFVHYEQMSVAVLNSVSDMKFFDAVGLITGLVGFVWRVVVVLLERLEGKKEEDPQKQNVRKLRARESSSDNDVEDHP